MHTLKISNRQTFFFLFFFFYNNNRPNASIGNGLFRPNVSFNDRMFRIVSVSFRFVSFPKLV